MHKDKVRNYFALVRGQNQADSVNLSTGSQQSSCLWALSNIRLRVCLCASCLEIDFTSLILLLLAMVLLPDFLCNLI